MSHLDSSFSTDDSDDGQSEVKRARHEPKNYSLNRRYERQQQQRPVRKTRPVSKDSNSQQSKENIEALILDSGAYSIKLNHSSSEEPKIIPNCIVKAKSERKRLFIGNQIDECRDCSGLFYLLPCERGYITKWDVQKPIWDYAFSKNICPVDNYPVVMTQPLFNFKSIQDCTDEIFFEEYEVSALFRTNPTDLAAQRYYEEIGSQVPCVVVDSGYSFTHVVPYIDDKKYFEGIRRINVGGKFLTNHLKDIISYRQYHVMEETFVINQVKEDTCYVSDDFRRDLQIASKSSSKNTNLRNYVLPDFNNIRRGYIQDPGAVDEIAENCQILRLNNERFTVPEILFNPSDIGLKSIGIAEAVCKAIMSCPPSYQKELSKNIISVGGCAEFPGFRDRLFAEVRSMMPASWEVCVYQPSNPITYSWTGGKSLLKDPKFQSKLVTKEQYEELGLSAIQEKFNNWYVPPEKSSRSKKHEVETKISYINHIKKYDVFGKGYPNESEAATENTDTATAAAPVAEPEKSNGDTTVTAPQTKNNEATDSASSKTVSSSKNDSEKTPSVNVLSELIVKPQNGDNNRPNLKVYRKATRSSGPIIYSVKIVSASSVNNSAS